MEIPPMKPHFFKPILPGFKNGLKIPIGFLKYLKGHGHIEHAILRRGGKKWLVKANRRRLGEGNWNEFVEELNLELGDILVFKHEGKMEFEVSIFNSSHCDREYVEYMQMEEEEKGVDMKEEDNKDEDDHEKENENEEVEEEDEEEKNKDEDEDEEGEEGEEDEEENEDDEEEEDEDQDNDEDEDEDDEDEEGEEDEDNEKDEDDNEEDEDHEYEDESEEEHEYEDTYEEGEEAATHFECTIRQYCLLRGFMWIPKHFAYANGLMNGANQKCGLIVIDERQKRSWNLMLTSSKTEVCINGDGWRKFSADNCLKEGDHITFEVVTNGETPIWKFRVVWDVETPIRKFQEYPKAKIKTSSKDFSNVEAAKDMYLSDNSHFICTIRRYCLSRTYLCIPKQFAQENRLNNRKCKILLRDKQRSWTFNVYTSGHHTCFGSEWHEFCKTKCLKEGDRLMFEIVSKGKTPIFRFHDLRGTLSSLQPEVKKKKSNAERMSSDKGLKRKNLKTLSTTTLKSQIASSTSIDANSHFIATIKPYTIKNPILYLPMDFVKSNGLMHRREMILVDEKQRSWSVCLGRIGLHFGIKGRWTKFRNANGVQVGDTYKFELIKNGTIPIVHFDCKYSGN